MARAIALRLIRLYQATVSPDHGVIRIFFRDGYCRFHPSCSSYAYGCIERFGVMKGSWLGLKRLVRCNPWSLGGNDPVPMEKRP
jgi:uncharacterized protein